jgi:hypothetical protein
MGYAQQISYVVVNIYIRVDVPIRKITAGQRNTAEVKQFSSGSAERCWPEVQFISVCKFHIVFYIFY